MKTIISKVMILFLVSSLIMSILPGNSTYSVAKSQDTQAPSAPKQVTSSNKTDGSMTTSPTPEIQGSKPSNQSEAYLVKFKDGSKGKSDLAKEKKQLKNSFKNLSSHVAVNLSVDEVLQLKKDKNVVYVEKDGFIQKSADQVTSNLLQIHVPEAQGQGFTGTNIRLGIMDTGIDSTSPELRIAGAVSFAADEPSLTDLNGHGTSMAGIAAALQDGQGLIGVAPNVDLYSLKVMNQAGTGTYSQVMQALDWAVEQQIQVLSMSFTGTEYSAALEEAMQYAFDHGVLLIGATGNNGSQRVDYPAKFSSVIAVGAVDDNNQLAPYSNTGTEVDFVAPGVNIRSLSLTPNAYIQLSGTSAAVPHVAGVAALLKNKFPAYSNQQIRTKLDQSAIPLGDSNRFGHGLVDAYAALQQQQNQPASTPTPTPTPLPTPSPVPTSAAGQGSTVEFETTNKVLDLLQVNPNDKWAPFKPADIEQIKVNFNPVMQQFAAHFYPILTSLLNAQQQVTLQSWSTSEFMQQYDQLTTAQVDLMRSVTPIVVQDYEYRQKVLAQPLDGNLQSTIQASAVDAYSFKEKNNAFHYEVDMTNAVDSLYKTSSQQDVDLNLAGKFGLDVTLTRRYNSLSAKLLTPTYNSNGGCDQDGSDYATSGPVSDCMYNEAYSALLDTSQNQNSNYIATGWELNIPVMKKSKVNPIQVSQASGYAYYNRLHTSGTDTFNFILDDGSSYEFRGTEKTKAYNHPYNNVRYNDTNTNGNYELLIDDGRITYVFSSAGQIISKSHYLGATINYSFSSNQIIIWDSVGRAIVISRSGGVITGFEAKDALGNRLYKIVYTVEQKGYTFIGKRQSLYVAYNQLNSVIDHTADTTDSDPAKRRILKTYTYVDPGSSTHADFNFEDDYRYNLDVNGKPVLDAQILESGVAYDAEASLIADRDVALYGEIDYLLLSEAFDNVTRFSTRYTYNYYDANWSTKATYQDRNQRGTKRLYLDPYILTYIGFHMVQDVVYSYTAMDGVEKSVPQWYYNMTDANEIWMRPKQGGEYGDFRLSGTNDLTSNPYRFVRGGHRVRNLVVSLRITDSYFKYISYYSADHGLFTKRKDSKYILTDFFGPLLNRLEFTEGDSQYTFSDLEDVTYKYEAGKTKPYLVMTFDQQNNSDPKPADIQNFLLYDDPIQPANLADYAALMSLSYDSYGNVLSSVDAQGNRTVNQYAGPKQQLSYSKNSSADGQTSVEESYTYDPVSTSATFNLVTNVVVKSTYPDPANPAISKTDTVTTTYVEYYPNKLPKTIKETSTGDQFGSSPLETTTTFQYDPQGLHVVLKTILTTLGTAQAPTSLSISSAYDNKDRVRTIVFADQSKVEYDYDLQNRIKSETFTPASSSPGSSRTTSYVYEDVTRQVTKILPTGEKSILTYTPYGSIEREQQAAADGTLRTTVINQLDDTGRAVTATLPFGDISKQTTYVYGSNQKLRSATDALGQTTTYSYATAMRKRDPGTTITKASSLQDTTKVVSPDGKEVWTYQDRQGRVTKQVEKSPTKMRTTLFTYSTLGKVVQKQIISSDKTETHKYGYDGFGQMILVEDALGQKYTYAYDRQGQLLTAKINGVMQKQKTYNELGWLLNSTNAAGEQEQYTYKTTGSVASFTDKAGQKTIYSYTEYNEPDRTAIQNLAGAEIYWQKYTYAPTTRLLSGITSSESESLAYTYDRWNRNDTKTVAGKMYVFGYDNADRSVSIIYPDQKKVNYTFDNLNRINTVNYVDANNIAMMSPVNYGYTWGSNEHVYRKSFGNGMSQESKTDAFGERVSVNHYANSTAANWTETFGYDGLGNITALTRNNTAYTYTYDNVNRIQQENLPSGQNIYTYDDRGNRQTLASVTLPPEMTWDSKTYTYNAANQLKTFTNNVGTTAAYSYYGDGLRATKTVNGQLTRYVYVNGKVIDELDASGNSKARNIWGNELLYRQNSTAADAQGGYYFFNGHGDVVKVTDNSGNVLNSYDYDIWGNVTAKTETMNNPFKYTGEMQDDETGFIYLRARYYDPSIGRFINEDTYEGQIDNPLSLNRYTYVENNPLIYSDPTGHKKAGDIYIKDSDTLGTIALYTKMWENADSGLFDNPAYMKKHAEAQADKARNAYWSKVGSDIANGISEDSLPLIVGAGLTTVAIPRVGAGSRAAGAGLIGIGIAIANYIDAAVSDKVTDTTASNNKSQTPIYRWGNDSNTNLTPRPVDSTGLSFSTKVPQQASVFTTLQAVNSTSVLRAIVDNPSSGHVSVTAVSPVLQREWMNSRQNAGSNPHYLTVLLKSLILGSTK